MCTTKPTHLHILHRAGGSNWGIHARDRQGLCRLDLHKNQCDKGGSTTVIGTEWSLTNRNQRRAHIKVIAEDWCICNIPLGTAITANDPPTRYTIILQDHFLSDNKYPILSSTQLREHGVKFKEQTKRHKGLQTIVVDGHVLPLSLQDSLLYLPLREPTDEDLNHCPIFTIHFNSPWNPMAICDADMEMDQDAMQDMTGPPTEENKPPNTHINKRIKGFFGLRLCSVDSTSCAQDHPDTDDSPFLTEQENIKYQRLIRCHNWVMCLGGFNAYHAMSG